MKKYSNHALHYYCTIYEWDKSEIYSKFKYLLQNQRSTKYNNIKYISFMTLMLKILRMMTNSGWKKINILLKICRNYFLCIYNVILNFTNIVEYASSKSFYY